MARHNAKPQLLFRGEIEGAAGPRQIFGRVLGDFAKLEAVTIAIFVANNGLDLDRATAEWWRELQLDKLSFLEFQDRIKAKPAFGEVMGSSLHGGLSAGISSDDLDAEIDLETGPLPLGRLSPSRGP